MVTGWKCWEQATPAVANRPLGTPAGNKGARGHGSKKTGVTAGQVSAQVDSLAQRRCSIEDE